jgi:hypothetical protein
VLDDIPENEKVIFFARLDILKIFKSIMKVAITQ